MGEGYVSRLLDSSGSCPEFLLTPSADADLELAVQVPIGLGSSVSLPYRCSGLVATYVPTSWIDSCLWQVRAAVKNKVLGITSPPLTSVSSECPSSSPSRPSALLDVAHQK